MILWGYKELSCDSSYLTPTTAQNFSGMTGTGIIEVISLLNKICESVEKVSKASLNLFPGDRIVVADTAVHGLGLINLTVVGFVCL